MGAFCLLTVFKITYWRCLNYTRHIKCLQKACFNESKLFLLTRESCGSNFKYFRTKSITDDIFFVRSTVHFLFFMIGASPVGFSRTSTIKNTSNYLMLDKSINKTKLIYDSKLHAYRHQQAQLLGYLPTLGKPWENLNRPTAAMGQIPHSVERIHVTDKLVCENQRIWSLTVENM